MDNWLLYVVGTGIAVQLAINGWLMRSAFAHATDIAMLKTSVQHAAETSVRIEEKLDRSIRDGASRGEKVMGSLSDLTVALAELKIKEEDQ